MKFLSHLILHLEFIFYTNSIRILVSEENKYPYCSDCIRVSSLLEGIESASLSSENSTLELLDSIYYLTKEKIDEYLGASNERNLFFKMAMEENYKNILCT